MPILTDDHRIQIDEAIVSLESIREEITLAKRAGIDLGDREAKLEDRLSRLRGLKETYFPNS